MDNLNLLDERPFDPDECYPWKGMKRCVLKPNGSLVGYLHPDDSNKWDSGDNIDWGLIESNGYNVMVEIPKFYYKKKLPRSGNFDDGHIWMISDAPRYGFEVHPAFMRCRDKLCDDLSGVAVEVDYRYAPAFEGWIDSQGRLRSLPNRPTQVSITIGNSRESAKKNGNGWGLFDFNLLFAIQLLFSLEYGTYNSQSVMYGFSYDNSSKRSTGDTLRLGNHSGNANGNSDNWYLGNNGKSSMSYRGIENLYGNISKWIDGLYCDSSRNILIANKGFNNTGGGYENCGKGGSSNIGGYIGNIQDNNEAGFIMKNTNNASSNKRFYNQGRLYSNGIPFFGGTYNDKENSGIFNLSISSSNNNSNSNIGCYLCF